MKLPTFEYAQPKTLRLASRLLTERGSQAVIIGGGTDILPALKNRLKKPTLLVDLGGIRRLSHLAWSRKMGLKIGALVTLSAIEDSGFIAQHYPVLREAVMTVASPLLRNKGTIGGNICLDTRCLWYNQSLQWRKACGFCIKKDGDLCHVAPGGSKCWAVFSGDTPPALLCLDAEVEVASPAGLRRVPLREFYTNVGDARMNLQKNEILTRVFLPRRSAGMRGIYRKLRIRGSIDYPLAGVAIAMRSNGHVEDARVAITAVNPAPLLVKNVDRVLNGRELNEETAGAVADLAARSAKPLTTSALTPEYRREMIRVFTKRALLELAGR
jgi:4-hydroxybenzoyl-CoA reductase subunit beta